MRFRLWLTLLALHGCATTSTPVVFEQSGTSNNTKVRTGTIFTEESQLELVERVAPEYPATTKAAGIQGTVQVKYRVNPNGSVSDVSVAKSAGPSLDRHAVAAVSQWKYKPFKGNPVYMQTPIVFKIEK